MEQRPIGIVHPGAMGVSIAANLRRSGRRVHWVSAGRSAATIARAREQGLEDAGTLEQLCAECAVVLSVCPPHAAEDVAQAVTAAGFQGLFVDANAIAPGRVAQIDAALRQAGIEVVDGGIIGGPAWQPGTTLYLAGPRASAVAALFSAGPLAVQVLGDVVGTASALKMCYAAYSKGTTALLAAILAAAEHYEVGEALRAQWTQDDPAFALQAEQRTRQATAKAWRFVGEMEEIAATFAAAGLPGGLHAACAEVYRRMAHFKDAADTPALDVVLAALYGEDVAWHQKV
jgi:3-hydroxyisobutyrate dehydrogenase-like beta-hydroxyacid dehydrogenase